MTLREQIERILKNNSIYDPVWLKETVEAILALLMPSEDDIEVANRVACSWYIEGWPERPILIENLVNHFASALTAARLKGEAEGQRKGLEEAAEIADKLFDEKSGYCQHGHGVQYTTVGSYIAAAIRSKLSEKENP